MRGRWAATTVVGTLVMGLGCGSLFEPERVEHPACRCSVEVPFLWNEMDLVDEDTLEVGSLADDRYVFAEFVSLDTFEAGVDLATLNDHHIGSDIPFDALEPPERRTIDGHRGVVRWLGDGAEVDGVPLQGVLASVAYPDGYVRMFAWGTAGDKGARPVLLDVVESLQRTEVGEGREAPSTSSEPFLDALRAAGLERAGRRFEWNDVVPPEGLVSTSYEVPADAELGPAVPMELELWASPVGEELRPAMVYVEPVHGTSEETDELLAGLAMDGDLVVARPFFRGGPGQPGTWDVLGSELLDLQAAVAHVRARPDVDPARVTLLGEGVGGGRVILAMTTVEGIQAGYAIDPPADLLSVRSTFSQLWGDMPYDGGDPLQDEIRSPVRYVPYLKGPVTVLSTQYSDLVGERALFEGAVPLSEGRLSVLPVDRMGLEETNGLVRKIAGKVAAGETELSAEEAAAWADASWSERAPDIAEGLVARVHAIDRVGLLSESGAVDYVMETRGDVDYRVAEEMLKAARTVEEAPARKRFRPTPLPASRRPSRGDAGRSDDPGPALRAFGASVREEGLLVRFGGSDDASAVAELAAEQGHQGYVFVRMEDIEAAGRGGTLPVLYGDVPWSEDGTRQLGRRLASQLRESGLQVDWDDDPGSAVIVVLPWAAAHRGAPKPLLPASSMPVPLPTSGP